MSSSPNAVRAPLQKTRNGVSAPAFSHQAQAASWSFSTDTTPRAPAGSLLPEAQGFAHNGAQPLEAIAQCPLQPGALPEKALHPSQHKNGDLTAPLWHNGGSSMAQWGPSALRGPPHCCSPSLHSQTDGHRPQQCPKPTQAFNIPSHPVTLKSLPPPWGLGETGLDREAARGWGSQRPGWSWANENLVGLFEKPVTVPVS